MGTWWSTARKNHWHTAYLYIAPVLLALGLFRVFPAAQTLVFSFFNVNLISRSYHWVGLKNFSLLLHDDYFGKAVANTLTYAFYIVVISSTLALMLSSLFTSGMKMGSVFKAAYFVPFITSTAAAAVVWSFLYDPRFGLFNMMLRIVGLPTRGWIASAKDALMSVIIFSIWKYIGYNMVIFIAGLQNIPDVYYEAATIDGAGPVTRFLRVTVPLLTPTIVFVLVYNSILSLKVFDQVFVLTSGGPAKASTVVVLELYEMAFRRYRFGYAASMAFVFFIMIIAVTLVQYLITRRWEGEY